MKRLIPVFFILTFLSGCSMYDRVAVWYKYRNDFPLPKSYAKVKSDTVNLKLIVGGKSGKAYLNNREEIQANAGKERSTEVVSDPKIQELIDRRHEETDRSLAPSQGSTIQFGANRKELRRLYRQLKPEQTTEGEPRKTFVGGILSLIFGGLGFLSVFLFILLIRSFANRDLGSLAIAIILLLVLIIIMVPFAIYGLVLGIIGIIETASKPDQYKNIGISIAGTILSLLYLTLFFAAIAAFRRRD